MVARLAVEVVAARPRVGQTAKLRRDGGGAGGNAQRLEIVCQNQSDSAELFIRAELLPVGQAFQPAFTVDGHQATKRIILWPIHQFRTHRVVVDVVVLVQPIPFISHQMIKIFDLPEGAFATQYSIDLAR